MKHLATIQTEFLKEARKWDDLTIEDQKAYLNRHPGSKRRLTARPKKIKPPQYKNGDIVAEPGKDGKVAEYWLITSYYPGNPNRSGPGYFGGPTIPRYKAKFITGLNSNGNIETGSKSWELSQDYVDKEFKHHGKRSEFVKKILSGKVRPASGMGLRIDEKFLDKKDVDLETLKEKIRKRFDLKNVKVTT